MTFGSSDSSSRCPSLQAMASRPQMAAWEGGGGQGGLHTVQCTSVHNYFATYCVVGMELYIKVSFVLNIDGKKIPLWAQTSRSRRLWSSTIQKYNTATHLQRNISVSPFGEDHILQQCSKNFSISKFHKLLLKWIILCAKVHSSWIQACVALISFVQSLGNDIYGSH